MKFRLHATDWQRKVVDTITKGDKRFVSLMAGRRAGKTFAFRTASTMCCLSKAGYKIWYIAPSYGQAKEQYEEMTTNQAVEKVIKKSKAQPYPKIWFKNGSTLGFRTFERPHNLRGSGLDMVWCDEIQDFAGDKFWSVVRPLISDRRGSLVISGQHSGKESWYYKDLFARGLKGDKRYDPNYESFNIPSWLGMVYQGDGGLEELRLMKQQMPDLKYRIEIACEAISSEAAVFRGDDLAASKAGDVSEQPMSGENYVIGLDLGRVVDPSAIVVLNSKNQVVFSECRPLGERHELGAEHASILQRRYNGAPVVIDSTSGGAPGKNTDEYIKYYKQKVKNLRECFWNYKSKKSLIEGLCLALEQHKIFIPARHKELHRQLSIYEYTLRSGGSIEYAAPAGDHDDLVAALAMAWMGRRYMSTRKDLGAMPAYI